MTNPFGPSRHATTLVLLGVLVLGAGGCLLDGDSGEPVLAIDLYWDERDGADRYLGGTCESAEVDTMKWDLIDAHGKPVAGSAGKRVECQDTVVAPEALGPGVYSLVVTGYDAAGNKVWTQSDDCAGFEFDRFDELYSCDIDR